jgi:hypothetical protein
MTEAIKPTYEGIQEQAKGPGVEEWRRADKARADLSEFYRTLQEDPRISDLARSEQAWQRYEAVKAQVEAESTKAKELSARSRDTLERLSIPTPESEGLITTNTEKLLLTQGEANRINRRLERLESVAGPIKPSSEAILKEEYARGLQVGGPQGGAICRAVVEIARDAGADINRIVDEHRKEHHRKALEDAQSAMMREQLISRSVSKPPFPHPDRLQQGGKGVGTYRNAPALIPTDRGALARKFGSNRRRPWK